MREGVTMKDKINATVGKNIRRLRKLNGMKQSDLGLKVGVSAPAISRWEAGRDSVSISRLITLTIVFQVELETFLKE